MPRNLTPFLYRRITGRTGHAPKPHALFISEDHWTNRACPETSRPFYMGGSLDEPGMPRNLTPFLYGRITGRTGQPHLGFTVSEVGR